MCDASEDFSVSLKHIGIIPVAVPLQSGATIIIIEVVLENQPKTYDGPITASCKSSEFFSALAKIPPTAVWRTRNTIDSHGL